MTTTHKSLQPFLSFERPSVPIVDCGGDRVFEIYVDGQLQCYAMTAGPRRAMREALARYADDRIAILPSRL